MANKDYLHGMCRTRPYNIWCNMKVRCNKPSSDSYKNYGGRDITYCYKWETFDGFWEDMKEGYSDNLSLDRENNNLNYNKENCRWIILADQARNRGIADNNTSGVTGVSWHFNRLGILYARARWVLDKREVCRYFSTKKYGVENAFEMACKAREEGLENLRKLGYCYGDNHGF